MNKDQCNPLGMRSWMKMNNTRIVGDSYSTRVMSLAVTDGHVSVTHF